MPVISRITKKKHDHIIIHGAPQGHPTSELARLEFHRYGHLASAKCPFILHLGILSSIGLTEKTARAFANHILRQCDEVKKNKQSQG